MEFEVNLNRWKYLIEQMQECRSKLLKNRAALKEQLQNFGRNLENEEMQHHFTNFKNDTLVAESAFSRC